MRRSDAVALALAGLAGALVGSVAERFLASRSNIIDFSALSRIFSPADPAEYGFDAFIDNDEQLENASRACVVCGAVCPEDSESVTSWHMVSVADGETPPFVTCSREHLEVYLAGGD